MIDAQQRETPSPSAVANKGQEALTIMGSGRVAIAAPCRAAMLAPLLIVGLRLDARRIANIVSQPR